MTEIDVLRRIYRDQLIVIMLLFVITTATIYMAFYHHCPCAQKIDKLTLELGYTKGELNK